MKRVRNFFLIAAGLFVLAVLLTSVLQSTGIGKTPNSQSSFSFEKGYPPPQPTEDAAAIAEDLAYEAQQAAEPDSALAPPIPTPLPTPRVTPFPVARFPIPNLVPDPGTPSVPLIYQDGNTLRAIDVNGQNDRLLFDFGANTSHFLANPGLGIHHWGAVSPDGLQLALILSSEPVLAESRGKSPIFGLYLFNIESGTLTLLAENVFEPAWSPDGNRIAIMSTNPYGVQIIDVQTNMISDIFPKESGNADHRYHFFTWAPDGIRLAFVRSTSMSFTGEIWVVNTAEEDDPVQLTAMDLYAGYLSWAPDGNQISFTSETGERDTPTQSVNLWIVEVDTQKMQQLTKNLFVAGSTPSWGLQSDYISFSAAPLLENEEPRYDLWLISNDTAVLTRLTQSDADTFNPGWVSNANLLFVQHENGALGVLDLGDGAYTQILPAPQTEEGWYFLRP